MNNIVITGTSSGIGKATAERLVQIGYRVFGSVRTQEHALSLQADLGDLFTPFLLDVTDDNAVRKAAGFVSSCIQGEGLYALVNNAGVAIYAPLMHLAVDDVTAMFDVNVLGVLRVTQAFLPLLGATRDAHHKPGRIVNISSISGKYVFPFMAAYAATKHALEALSDGFRRELYPYGIDVIVIEPGNVNTPIFDKYPSVSPYIKTDYGTIHQNGLNAIPRSRKNAMPVDTVADCIVSALAENKPKTRYIIDRGSLKRKIKHAIFSERYIDRRIAQGDLGRML